MNSVPESQDSQVSHHYQTLDPAEISLCAKEAKVRRDPVQRLDEQFGKSTLQRQKF
jgi:hypothetical protein